MPGDEAHAQVVVSRAGCIYVRSWNDLSNAEPAALGPCLQASLPFFVVADHHHVVGVRCQS